MCVISDVLGAIRKTTTKNHPLVLVILSVTEVEPDTNSVSHGALGGLIIE